MMDVPSPFWIGFRPAAAAGLFHLTAVVLYLLPVHGDVSALVCVKSGSKGQAPFEAVHSGFTSCGYDGQYYYAIAQAPWQRQDEVIDQPCYRHVRILYPALAWLLSGGDPHLLLWTMPLINWAAVVGTAWLGALLAVHYRRVPWWGALLPIAVNSVMPSFRDLTDPVATFTVIGLLTAWILEWPGWSLLFWGAAASFSREQNITFVFILALEAFVARRAGRFAALACAGLIWTAWVLALRSVYGVWPMVPGNVCMPLSGIWHLWTHPEGSGSAPYLAAHLVRISVTAGQFIVGIAVIIRGERLSRLIALAGVSLAIVASPFIYCDGIAYSRVLNWIPLAIWLWSTQSGRRWAVLVLLAGLVWPLAEIVRVNR
jgi:hypothetical protein